ncbi:hypothetical protein Tco_0363491 [Tanacetum coccineum]
MNTRDKTRNLSLKEIAVAKGPVPINFEQGDKQTLNPLGPHAAHWSNYIGEVVRSVPLYYPSWEKVPKERKAAIISEIGTLFDLRPHMIPPADPTTGELRSGGDKAGNVPRRITAPEGGFVSRSLARLPDEMEEMKRLEATGEYTEDEINALARGGKLRGHIPGVGRVLPSRATSRPSMPAPDKSLKSMHRKVDFMMSLFRSDSKYSDMFKEFESGGASGSGGCGDDEEGGV